MNSSSSDTGLLAKVKSLLFNSWLLIIVAGLIILGLSAGALPLALMHLAQMVGKWSTLHAASGSAMFVPFVILLLQVLFFLVAWAVLVLVIVRQALGLGQVQSAPAVSVVIGLPAPAPSPSTQDAADAVAPPDTANADADEHNPFDMSAAIFEPLPDLDDEEEEPPAPAIVEEEPVFVYGDPLDGDLPEIFSYDTALMRDVQEQREKARRARAQTERVDSSNVKEEPDASGNRDKDESGPMI
jgi:hypothetical protein